MILLMHNQAATQIFQIRFFLVYLRLLKGDKSDSSIFSMIIFGFLSFLLFLLSFWVIITYLGQF
jgi:hypothetical protein